jgi:hypothetical protein
VLEFDFKWLNGNVQPLFSWSDARLGISGGPKKVEKGRGVGLNPLEICQKTGKNGIFNLNQLDTNHPCA